MFLKSIIKKSILIKKCVGKKIKNTFRSGSVLACLEVPQYFTLIVKIKCRSRINIQSQLRKW